MLLTTRHWGSDESFSCFSKTFASKFTKSQEKPNNDKSVSASDRLPEDIPRKQLAKRNALNVASKIAKSKTTKAYNDIVLESSHVGVRLRSRHHNRSIMTSKTISALKSMLYSETPLIWISFSTKEILVMPDRPNFDQSSVTWTKSTFMLTSFLHQVKASALLYEITDRTNQLAQPRVRTIEEKLSQTRPNSTQIPKASSRIIELSRPRIPYQYPPKPIGYVAPGALTAVGWYPFL